MISMLVLEKKVNKQNDHRKRVQSWNKKMQAA